MRVREALSKVDGVDQVEIDFKAKTATLTTKPGKSLTQEQCQQAFAGTKYEVESMTEKEDKP